MLPDDDRMPLARSIAAISGALIRMNPGGLARLRRMNPDGPGEGEYWQLVATLGFQTDTAMMRTIRMMAMLTPRGEPGPHKQPPHQPARSLGWALADSGFPEMRLLRFLALPLEMRPDALERLVRWLAARGDGGVNCLELSNLLNRQDPSDLQRLANDFYRTRINNP